MTMRPIVTTLLGLSISVALVGDALAGALVRVPGPVAGVGLPALAVVGGAYWLVRKFRNRQG
jgi:uncharacterized membrane protein